MANFYLSTFKKFSLTSCNVLTIIINLAEKRRKINFKRVLLPFLAFFASFVFVNNVNAQSVNRFTVTDVLCFGTSTGAIDIDVIGGVAPYTYLWSNGAVSQNISFLAAGGYSVTITDKNNATSSANFTVLEPDAIALTSATVTSPILCFGGSATVTILATGGSAPLSYTFNSITNTTGVFTGVSAGTNLVYSITDANSCGPLTGAISVTQPTAISLSSATVTSPILCNGGTATVTIVATGGTGAISYTFNSQTNTTGIFTGVLAGNNLAYSITDANGCGLLTGAISVTQPSEISITSITSNTPICAGSTLNLTSAATGGTGALVYSWTGPNGFNSLLQNSSILTATTAASGIYTLKVTDANGCSKTSTTTVTVNPLPTISLGILPVFCPGAASFALVYMGTSSSPTTYSLSAGTSALAGFVPVVNAALSGSPLIISLPALVPAGTYQFIITVKNANGCVSTPQTFDVTFLDITPPTISCPADVVVLSNGSCTATGVALGVPVTNDNCGVQSVTNNGLATYPLGVTNVIWTVTDGSGNFATCTQKVTVLDQTPPTAICKNISVNLDAAGNAVITAADINNGSSDACGSISLVASKTNFNCSNIGANSVTLTVTDNSGNVSSCISTVTIVDNMAPVALCKSITLFLNASGAATLLATDIDNGSSDNCSFTRSISKSSFNCTNIGANTVVLTITDASGNTATCNASVTVVDNIAPVAQCKNFTINLNTSGNATLLATDIDNGSTDNCSIATHTVSPSSFTCANVGNNTVTLTVTDASGNSSTCTATVIVKDLIAPVALCKPFTIYLDNTGNAVLTTANIDNGSSDNCGPVTLSLSKTAFNCSNRGTNTVTLTVTDVAGNASTCTATVTVVDNIAPVATCKNFTLVLNAATGTGTLLPEDINNGSTDNCGIVSMTLSKTNFACIDANGAPQTVTLTVTDASGNSSSCTATVTIQTTLTISSIFLDVCGYRFNSTVTGGQGPYSYVWDATAPGNLGRRPFTTCLVFCPTTNTSNQPSPFYNLGLQNGTYTTLLTVTDANGCKVTRTLTFDGGPLPGSTTDINSQACLNQTITYTSPSTGSSYAWTITGGTALSPLTGNTVTVRWDQGVGARTVRLVVRSFFGLCNSTLINHVTVYALPIPVVTMVPSTLTVCPQSSQTFTLQANSFATRNWTITGGTVTAGGDPADNSVTVKWGNGATGTVNVSVTNTAATGGCTASISPITINIVDNTPPSITCPTNVVTNANTGSCFATGVNLGLPVTSDNCGAVASVINNAPASFPIGNTTVTWTVTDYKGNTATCTQTVTVIDNQFPGIACQANITTTVAAAACTQSVVTNNPTTSDNCSISKLTWAMTGATVASSPITGINYVGTQIFNSGVTTVTYIVTDASGKSASCSFTVTITDNISPTITCPANIAATTNFNCTATGVALGTPTTSDNCSVASVTNNAPAAYPLGVTTVTWTVTDGAGNTSTCAQTVTVTDNVNPTITCPGNIVTVAALNACTRSVLTPDPVTTDNCSISKLTWTMTGATGASSPAAGINNVGTFTFNQGVTTIQYIVTDGAGNINNCSFTVTVNDDQKPTLSPCPVPAVSYLSDLGQLYATLSFTAPSATDNCSVPVVTWAAPGASPASGNGNIANVQFPIGSTVVTYSATDAAGNITSCNYTVIVVGPPVITCPANVTDCVNSLDPGFPVLVSGTSPVSYGWEMTGATMASGTGTIGLYAFNPGITTITWTASNIAGSATCVQMITVNSSGQWLGYTSDWNDAGNWCGGIPTGTSNVIIPVLGVGFVYPSTSTGNALVNNLTIATGANVTIDNYIMQVSGAIVSVGAINANNGTLEFTGSTLQTITGDYFTGNNLKTLIVSNDLTASGTNLNILESISFGSNNKVLNTGDNITLKSTDLSTASVGKIESGNDVLGTMTIERYLKNYRKWRFLATPVQTNGSPSFLASWGENATGYGTRITGPGGNFSGDNISPGYSVKSYNSANGNYDFVMNPNLSIANKEGYMIFVRGDYSATPTNSVSTATNLRIKGNINKGDQQFTVGAGKFLSLGNPYPSAVSAAQILTAGGTQLNNNYLAWDPSLNGTYNVGGYQTISDVGSGFYKAVPGGTDLYQSLVSYPNIQSGQSIFLFNNSATSLTFNLTESMKVNGSSGALSRTNTFFDRELISSTLFTSANIIADGNLVAFDDELTNNIDRDDAKKISNSGENFGLLRNGEKLAIEARARISDRDTIFYNMSNIRQAAYKLAIMPENFQNPASISALIVDKYLSTETAIDLAGDTTWINFSGTAAAASRAADRFMLVFKAAAAGPLPVTLTGISANRNPDRSIAIRWTVENEVNIEKYEIERSADGRNFTGIITADPTNSNAYTKNDLSPLVADNFYRIKAITMGGYTQYSAIVKVTPLQELASITVSPNPVIDGRAQVRFVNQTAGTYELKLFNQSGQLMQQELVKVNGSSFVKSFVLNNNFAGGVYQLTILNPDGTSTVQQLIIK